MPGLVDGSCRDRTVILMALSRSSLGCFLGADMLLILPWIQSLHQSRAGSDHNSEEPSYFGRQYQTSWTIRRSGNISKVGIVN
ncbi:hypothetical protein GCM10009590_30190 [Brachybacterium alimentarium]